MKIIGITSLLLSLLLTSTADARGHRHRHHYVTHHRIEAPRGTVIVHRYRHRHYAKVAKPRHYVAAKSLKYAKAAKVANIPALGLITKLAEKVKEIQEKCGSKLVSGVRHTLIAGTHTTSLHAYGKAADVQGNPSCIYANLQGWQGGYSVDYKRVAHVHISYDPDSKREWGARFAHGGGGHHRHYAHRRHHRHYAAHGQGWGRRHTSQAAPYPWMLVRQVNAQSLRQEGLFNRTDEGVFEDQVLGSRNREG